MKIRERDTISFWNDNWIEDDNLATILDMSLKNIPNPNVTVSEYIK